MITMSQCFVPVLLTILAWTLISPLGTVQLTRNELSVVDSLTAKTVSLVPTILIPVGLPSYHACLTSIAVASVVLIENIVSYVVPLFVGKFTEVLIGLKDFVIVLFAIYSRRVAEIKSVR